jgi:hypothetical protein
MAASALMGPASCRFILAEPDALPRVVLNASVLGRKTEGNATFFSGQWRVRFQGAEVVPILKFGLETNHTQTLEKPGEALQPLDTGAWALDYLNDTFKKLGESAQKKNLNQALRALPSEQQ